MITAGADGMMPLVNAVKYNTETRGGMSISLNFSNKIGPFRTPVF